MQQQADDKEQLEKEKALVEKKLAEQEASKEKLEGLKASLVSQKQELNKLIDELEAEQDKLLNEKKSLEVEFHDAHEVGKELTAKIAAEQKRAAEAARKAEEERKRKAAAAAAVVIIIRWRWRCCTSCLKRYMDKAGIWNLHIRIWMADAPDLRNEKTASRSGYRQLDRYARLCCRVTASFHMQVRWVPMGMSS